MKKLRHMLWQLPVLIGAGAVFASGARATVSDASGDRNEAALAAHNGQVVVKLENDQVYFSQDAGRTFEPLGLTATSEAARLKGLLRHGAHAQSGGTVTVAPTVVADGAGGWQWARPKDTSVPDSTARPAAATSPARPVADRNGVTNEPKGPTQIRPE